MRPRRTALFRLGLACALAAGLAACGRKGPLDLPPADSAAVSQQQQQQSRTPPLVSPLGGSSQPAQQNPAAPNRAFVLDPMLN